MVALFRIGLEAAARRGILTALVYSFRALVDVVRRGAEERVRSGVPNGHGRPPRRLDRVRILDGWLTDVRLAVRALRRSPGFTLSAAVVLALGIGANTTVFTALRSAVLAPPPFPEAERLVLADLTMRLAGSERAEPFMWSYPKFELLQASADGPLDRVIGYANRAATLTGTGPAEMINLETVSPGYFDLIGRPPVLGRAFTADDSAPAASPVAVLSHQLWVSRFGGAADAIGGEVLLNGIPLTVVGVAPPGFDGITGGARLWMPIAATADVFSAFMIENSGAHWFQVIARLRPDATVEVARSWMEGMGDGISEAFPPPNARREFSGSARSLLEARANPAARSALIALSAAAGLVLLVACANLSGLLLARSRRRSRDAAVRSAVGASRWRIVRASLIESLTLAALGGAIGVMIALVGARVMAAAWPRRFLSGAEGSLRATDPSGFTVDGTVLFYALLVTGVTALLAGSAPALRATAGHVGEQLRDGSGATRRARRWFGYDLRSGLVGLQVALALALLVGAGLVGGSARRLLDVDPGFRAAGLLAVSYSIPASSAWASEPNPFHRAFTDALEQVPGVESATFGCAPLRGRCILTRVDDVEGQENPPVGEGPEIGMRMVDRQHFDVLGVPLLSGRTFESADIDDGVSQLILNRIAAREIFGDEDPIGRQVRLGMQSAERGEYSVVVGVVGDVRYGAPDEVMIAEGYYFSEDFAETFGTVTLRASGDPLTVVPALREVMAELDPTVALFRVEALESVLRRSVADRDVVFRLLAVFAMVTILLAAAGTWAVVAFLVADRRKEIGLRLALGAGSEDVVRGIVGEGARAAGLGVVLGLLVSSLGSGLLTSLLWGMDRMDPLTYGGGAAVLVVVVLMASWLPARRATGVDPAEALRAE